MAASSNTTWSKGFSGNPEGEARTGTAFTGLVGAIGGEQVSFPPGGDDAVAMTRLEALARVLWTRAVIDGDMTAIKLLVEQVEGKGKDAGGGGIIMNAETLAEAAAALDAWAAECAADRGEAGAKGETDGGAGA